MNDYNFMDYYYQNMNGYNLNNQNMPNVPNMPNMINIPNMPNEPIKLDSEKGFIRGNMFDDLYDPYKNYIPLELNPNNDMQALLEKVQQYNFATTDLNLYLDNYPNDKDTIKIFNNYRNMYLTAVSNFEKIYGPIEAINNPVNVNTWVWDKNPWPWEVQK